MLLKGKLNDKFPMLTDKGICLVLKARFWEKAKGLLIADAIKKDMTVFEYIKYLKNYHKIHKTHH